MVKYFEDVLTRIILKILEYVMGSGFCEITVFVKT